ncbi:MAG: hypothetical protein ACRDT4_10695 [Micromonosporaceae bacterium]
MMNTVLALAELGAEVETDGFLGIYSSGNSNDSNNCGSSNSEGC